MARQMGKENQPLQNHTTGGQDPCNEKRRTMKDDSGQLPMKKQVIEEEGRPVGKECLTTISEVKETSREWSQVYK